MKVIEYVSKKEGHPEERPINKKYIIKMNLYEYTKTKLIFFIKKAPRLGCPYIELF